MALDGIFLHAVCLELQSCIMSRIDKLFQISKFEFVFELRRPKVKTQLLISVNPSSPRINLTNKVFSKIKNVAAFCAVLRKHLLGARLVEIKQRGFDRILFLEFETRNAIGDFKKFSLVVELMGKHSNLILLEKDSKRIIDVAKKFDGEFSKLGPIESKRVYRVVELQNKLNVLNCSLDRLLNRIFLHRNFNLSRAIIETIEGVSMVVARDLAFGFDDRPLIDFDENEKKEVFNVLKKFKEQVELNRFKFCVFLDENKPKEFCWFELKQFGNLLKIKQFESASELLDSFYDEKILIERINQQCYNVVKLIENRIKKANFKKNVRIKEFSEAENYEEYKLNADLLNANLYKIKKGDTSVLVENFYDDGKKMEIKLNSSKTPIQNLQSLYRKYRKFKVARSKLKGLIADCDDEIAFLNSELDLVLRAKNEDDVLGVFSDLIDQGFCKNRFVKNNLRKINKQKMNFLKFKSTDGFIIYCGRNNSQNDYLTLKKAKKTDLWFHIQGYSGSHVVVFLNGASVTNQTIFEAATIAAFYSQAKIGSAVAVDYTLIKNVTKPSGGRLGMVIFKNFKTVYVDPDENLVNKLIKSN